MFNTVSNVRGVVTQGLQDTSNTFLNDMYVASYQVVYRLDATQWQTATGRDSSVTMRYFCLTYLV
jgi:hypothetical protein